MLFIFYYEHYLLFNLLNSFELFINFTYATLVFEIRLYDFVLDYLVMFLAAVYIVTYCYVYFIMYTECLVSASEQGLTRMYGA